MNSLSLAIAALVTASTLLAAACGGSGASCRNNSDCASGLFCAGPNGPPSCGIPPQQGCMDTSNCPMGEVCHAVFDACSASGLGSQCGPPCGACGTGLRCNAQGACEAIPCDQGFACASFQFCDPVAAHATGPVYQITHGCGSACTEDAACPAGAVCVNGSCQSGPGQCEHSVAVP